VVQRYSQPPAHGSIIHKIIIIAHVIIRYILGIIPDFWTYIGHWFTANYGR